MVVVQLNFLAPCTVTAPQVSGSTRLPGEVTPSVVIMRCLSALHLFLAYALAALTLAGIIDPPQSAYYWHGRDIEATLSCVIDTPVNGRQVIWSHNGYFLSNSSKHWILDGSVSGNFSLTIFNLLRNDTGRYVCQIQGDRESLRLAEITVAGNLFHHNHITPEIIIMKLLGSISRRWNDLD